MEKSFGHHLDVQEALVLLARPSTTPTPYKWILREISLMKKLTETREWHMSFLTLAKHYT
jgi:hypothetical protein